MAHEPLFIAFLNSRLFKQYAARPPTNPVKRTIGQPLRGSKDSLFRIHHHRAPRLLSGERRQMLEAQQFGSL